ncbi:MAG: glycosyltransferase family 4 protein [Candidatus Eremiobacteraeota bacterium]|nr:glycosyltransferase family 4 protein [Candidatus Eremiobacteraeota bacterium]MBC5827330.1 glycosyltransferase family 4 protein [Candidatus Eremiobacteraeota bacterium]
MTGLRLAVLSSIAWPTPPPGYGPWEQVSATIADGMHRRGLDVTLFATGNSATLGALRSTVAVGLEQDRCLDPQVFSALHIGRVFERAHEFDLIHNNFDWKPLTYALATSAPPLITTVHGFSSPYVLAAYYAGAWRSFYSSISNFERDPGLNYLATVYHGIDASTFSFVPSPGDYLAFLGRFHEEKGAHLAIEIAKSSGTRIKLAGIRQDERYFRERIQPHVDGDNVQYLGPVERDGRNELLSGALALVHMTTRPERFGLTLVEAMACGTPILGARMGSIPEIVVDGITGYLCDDAGQAVARVPQLRTLSRQACRAHVERNFTVDRMIDGYLDCYREALRLGLPAPPSATELAARRHDWWDRELAFTDRPPKSPTLP